MHRLVVLLLLGSLYVKGCSPSASIQTEKITRKVTLSTLQACEMGTGPCPDIILYRSSIQDSVLLEFPVAGTSSQVRLLETMSDKKPLLSTSALVTEELMFLDLTATKDGKYLIHYLSCGAGCVLALQLHTMPTDGLPAIDTIDR